MRRAVLLVFLLLLVAGSTDATVRVLPLGDSLTKGSTQTPAESSHPTYRYWLWQQIGGEDVDFVGSWTSPNFPYSYDQDNEGHGGYMTDGILNGVAVDPKQGKLSLWLEEYDFDVALVMLGTNDVLNNVPTADTIRNLEGIIAELRKDNPRAVILLAQIPPTSILRPNLIALNAAIPDVATRLSTPDSPVITVDMFTGYDGVRDNQPPTGIHPGESGEKKIAARWSAALRPFLSGVAPPTQSSTPTQVPTVTSTPVTPGPVAPNVVRNPGATVYCGERGLDITAAGVGSEETLGWFTTESPVGEPAVTLRITDPRRAAIPHDARTGRWFNLDRGRQLALVVEEPALSLRLIDTATGRYVTGGEVAKGRAFDLEITGELSAFRARGTGAPVAVRVKDPNGRVSATLVGNQGVPQSLERVIVVQTPHLISGSAGAAWNTNEPAYPAGGYALWAEALLDHEHGTSSPDPTGAVGRQVSAQIHIRLESPSTPATSTPVIETTVTTVPTSLVTTMVPAQTTSASPASTTFVGPVPTTEAPGVPVTQETSWWFPLFLAALAAVFVVAGGGIWWALRSSGCTEDQELKTVPPRIQRAPTVMPRATITPAVQGALERVRTFDPERGEVQALRAALRTLERAEQVRSGRTEIDLLSIVPVSSIPTLPIPDPIKEWAHRVRFVPLSYDRHGSALFYAPVQLQGGTRLVVKRAEELQERRY